MRYLVLVFLLFALPVQAQTPLGIWTHVVWSIFSGTQAMKDALAAITVTAPLQGTQTGVQRVHAVLPPGSMQSLAGATYVAQWDGVAPCVTVIVGTFSQLNMAYLGWPMVAC